MKSGFTLIELIIVIGLFITIGSFATPFASSFLTRIYHENAKSLIITSLHRSQSLSMEGKGSGEWGICLIDHTLRIYTGSCASPTQKEDSTIPQSIAISGLSDTTFTRVTGEPSQSLTITITSSLATTLLTLNSLGVLNVN